MVIMADFLLILHLRVSIGRKQIPYPRMTIMVAIHSLAGMKCLTAQSAKITNECCRTAESIPCPSTMSNFFLNFSLTSRFFDFRAPANFVTLPLFLVSLYIYIYIYIYIY